ncbi:TPA: GNAT family N-acetyltransferase [Legionella pneumophila]|uniref:Bifunctional AAC/APH n=2 Tax=Legionellaceae TaxID=444 RepID=A0A377GB46_9GAMM|nr:MULTISPECIES: GNAT family N-acetyltransferase [Legionellaceae]HAT9631473.1 GNAT family N-acetyltransferase [Legionella pneumophila subsp. pneumophila]KTC90431.1 GNAT family acetyltransferase [Fluoribacter dumoffii NY 23]KTD68963.1 GNAT family acetyltransferase [Legionella steelei]MCW8483225.1 acetyltransferase [Fluoribacter dumoffii]STO21964.1 Bifunctional AAC/APH [Fluoribacter dumoffii]
MTIFFRSLSEQDFPLLLKWLETPHVKTWWDSDVVWTMDKITRKYGSYLNQYKIENGKKKSIFAFIILLDEQPIGYIQYYDVCDFLNLPADKAFDFQKSAAIDFYLGEKSILGQGLGSVALKQFVQNIVFQQFDTALVTPDIKNHSAIACYQKAGFMPCLTKEEAHELWLIAKKEVSHVH